MSLRERVAEIVAQAQNSYAEAVAYDTEDPGNLAWADKILALLQGEEEPVAYRCEIEEDGAWDLDLLVETDMEVLSWQEDLDDANAIRAESGMEPIRHRIVSLFTRPEAQRDGSAKGYVWFRRSQHTGHKTVVSGKVFDSPSEARDAEGSFQKSPHCEYTIEAVGSSTQEVERLNDGEGWLLDLRGSAQVEHDVRFAIVGEPVGALTESLKAGGIDFTLRPWGAPRIPGWLEDFGVIERAVVGYVVLADETYPVGYAPDPDEAREIANRLDDELRVGIHSVHEVRRALSTEEG